jgi:hypothetical protein
LECIYVSKILGLYVFTVTVTNLKLVLNPFFTNIILEMWLGALSKQPYHISEMLGTCCNLNAAVREGRVPFIEVFKGLAESILFQPLLESFM